MIPIIFALGALLLLSFVVITLLFQRLKKTSESQDFEYFLELFQQDQALRHREQESLRGELRENAKSLREEFFRVNKTVDTKLSESSKQLNERLDKSSNVIFHLQKELGKMGEIGAKIENLNKILRAPKGRGSMGEESLEEILRSIFPPNLWERQYSLLGVGLVDVAIKTSNGIIPIDAKFPLPAFERIVEAENEAQREVSQKDFQKDVKMRINEVSKYIRPELGTLNFAILFLPNENIYYEAVIRSSIIADHAREKKVLIAGPNTMIYILQTLFQAYQSQKFAQKAQEALSQLSGIKRQAERLDDCLGVLGRHLGNAHSKLTEVQVENTKLQGQIETVSLLQSVDTKGALGDGNTE